MMSIVAFLILVLGVGAGLLFFAGFMYLVAITIASNDVGNL